jgi:hypothetical protein
MAVITAISAMLAVPIGLFLSVAFDPSLDPSFVLVPAGFFAPSLATVVIKGRVSQRSHVMVLPLRQ